MLVRGRIHRLEVVSREDIERVEQGDSARGRRGCGHDARTVILAEEGLALDDPIGREILEGPYSAAGTHAVHEISRDAPRIKSRGPLLRDGLERVGKIG